MNSAPRTRIDEALVREAQQAVPRDDLELTIARPDEYADVEAASRGAAAGDVMTPLTAELLEWFNDRNPCGPGFVVVARDPATRRVAGHFVFYPWKLKVRDGDTVREIPTYIHIRLWVSGDFRRRGVFLSMTNFGLELVRRMGIGIAYTVPNQKSAPGFIKLGEQHAGDLPFWIRPLVPGWTTVMANQRTRGLEVESRREFDATFDGCIDAAMPAAASAWGPRSAGVLNWRYAQRPDFEYAIRYVHRGSEPVGYLVTRRMQIKRFRTVAVCDFWSSADSPGALRAALDDELRSGPRADLVVAFGGNVSGTSQAAFRGAGLIPCPKKLQPQPVSVIGGGIGEGPGRVELPTLPSWYLTPCDWDVF